MVVGAGVGGLAAAVWLGAAGWRVTVHEAHHALGGKAGTTVVDGLELDTGPSVLTLPDVFDEVLRAAGTSLAAEVELVRPDPAFRYRWRDGAALDVFVELDRTLASVRGSLGADAERQLGDFVAYAGRIWDAAGPRFVRGPAPTFGRLLSWGALQEVARIDPLRTMAGAILQRVTEPHLRDVLLRYATYTGSDPRTAPATLNCIAHVELALGGFGVRGGIAQLVAALARAAEAVGVEVRRSSPVRELRVADGRALGVVTDAGFEPADAVVSNADVTHLHRALLGGASGPGPTPTSTSGWTALVRAEAAPRAGHTVTFPADYSREFADLFDAGQVPHDPAIYVCAQSPAHGRPGWPDGTEALFVMVNAPPEPQRDHPLQFAALEESVLQHLRATGQAGPGAVVRWRRTPAELAQRFPGSAGALYGPASDGPWAAFRRTPNRFPGVRGLYVASGTAHPGGGLPLVALSGREAARAALDDVR